MMKRNDGFTLVELMVSIAISTVITAGVLSILLFGMRINIKTTDNVKQQNAMNMLSQIVQKVAEESNIIIDEEGKTITNADGFKLEFVDKKIKMNGTVFMEDVLSFEAKIDPANNLLTVTIQVGESSEKSTEYTTKAYCRLYSPPANEGDTTE